MLRLIISNGMLAASANCQTLGVLRTLGYTGQGAQSNKMIAGGAGHLLLEQWMQGKDPDTCLKVFEEAYRQYSDTYVPDSGRDSQLRWENLDRIFKVYLGLNSLNSVNFDVVETERQLVVELYREPGLLVQFSDKMDGKVRMHASGALMSFEHKTGERISDDWFEKYMTDGQISGHVYAARCDGTDVAGVVLNAIQFASLPDLSNANNLKKNGEFRSCKEHHMPLDQCQLDHVKFARREFYRSAADLEQWKAAAIAGALEYYKSLVDSKMSLDGIRFVGMRGLMHGSCSRCEMRDFCGSHRMNQNLLIKAPQRDASVVSSGIYED